MMVNSSLQQQILILKMESIAIISHYVQMICISIPRLRTLRWCFTVVTASSDSPVGGTCFEYSYGYWHSCMREYRNCVFMKCTSDAFVTFCCLYSDALSTCLFSYAFSTFCCLYSDAVSTYYGLYSDTSHTFCCLHNDIFIIL